MLVTPPSATRSSSPASLPPASLPDASMRALPMNLQELLAGLGQVLHLARSTGMARVVSVVLPVSHLDPLAVLERVTNPGISFYLEKNNQAAVAWRPLLQLEVEGSGRFEQAQHFIQTWQARLHRLGSASTVKIQFFCSFGFADQAPHSSGFAAATIFLPCWQVSRQGNDCAVVANLLIQPDTDLQQTIQQFQRDWQQLPLNASSSSPASAAHTPIPTYPIREGNRFKGAVRRALQAIKAGQFEKLVLAQVRDWRAPQPIDPFRALARLRLRYPECHVFCFSNGAGQNFLGASPERLLRLEQGELVVDALAGSAPRGPTPVEDLALAQRLLHSDKELREHRVLIADILHVLQAMGLTPQQADTGLLVLPNIQHLQTLITAQVPAELSLLAILAQLHPTPAVAGFPRAIARQQLSNYEEFERGLYAAPLGWLDTQGNGEFIVGLRSALICGKHTRLYAGAGVVAGSDPEREFQEIQLKLQALLEVLC